MLPPTMPEAQGVGFVITDKVDADHAGETVTQRSQTGFLIYLNSLPIYWMSKKQGGIESSSFGSEFVAMKQDVEAVRGLRYKLRMMGVPLSGPAFVYGDNMSVIHNTSNPASTLKKKSNSVCYYFVRESAAMGEIIVAHIETNKNVADIAMKVIPAGMKWDGLVEMLLHDILDHS